MSIQQGNRARLSPHDLGVACISVQTGFVTSLDGTNETQGTLTHFGLTFSWPHDSQNVMLPVDRCFQGGEIIQK